MKLKLTLIALLSANLLFSTPWWQSPALELDMQTGYRQDSLKWSIAGPHNHPNILSELEWKDLKIWEIGATAKLTTQNNIYLRANGDYGRIFSGRNRDSDYDGDHRTEEFSRSTADAGKGYVYDLSVGAGRQYTLLNGSLSLFPLAGLSFHQQHLSMYHGKLIVADYAELGRFSGLNSRYTAQWAGPWIGFDATYQATCDLTLLGTFEYHWVRFDGRGRWNLRRDFIDDFRHEANGRGYVGSLGAVYDLGCNWSLGCTLGYQNWKTSSGHDKTKVLERFRLPDGSIVGIPVTIKTRLNKVEWHTFSALATLVYWY